MKTIQITIGERLLKDVDKTVSELQASRPASTREALTLSLQQFQPRKLEAQHTAGYERHPVAPDEFDDWENEQVWGDE